MRFLGFGLEGSAEKIGSMAGRFLKLGGNDGNYKALFGDLYGGFMAELALIDLTRFPDFPQGIQFLLYMTSSIRFRLKGNLWDILSVDGLWLDRLWGMAAGMAANKLKILHKASGAKDKSYSEQDLSIMNGEETVMKMGIISKRGWILGSEGISVSSEVDLEPPSQPVLL